MAYTKKQLEKMYSTDSWSGYVKAQQDEEKKQAAKNKADEAARAAQAAKDNNWKGKAVKGAANLTKTLVKGAVAGEKEFAKGIARVLPGGTADLQANTDMSNQASDTSKKVMADLKAGKITKEQAVKLTKAAAENADQAVTGQKSVEKTMPTKGSIALGAASTAADIITAGTFSKVKGAKLLTKPGMKGAAELAPVITKKAARVTSRVAANANAGLLNAAASNAGGEESKQNLAVAGVAGAVFPEVLSAVGKGLGKVIKKGSKGVDDTTPTTDVVDDTTPTTDASGNVPTDPNLDIPSYQRKTTKAATNAVDKTDLEVPAYMRKGKTTTGEIDTAGNMDRLYQEAIDANYQASASEFAQIQVQRGIDNAAATTQKALPTGAVRGLSVVDADIYKLQTEGDHTLTNEQVKEKFIALTRERDIAAKADAERGFVMQKDAETNTGKSAAEIKAELDAVNNGQVPDTVKTPDTKVEGAIDVFAHPNMPDEIKTTANKILNYKGQAQQILDTLVTREQYDARHLDMDAAYKQREAEIAAMPAPRQDIELKKLDEKYMQDLNDLEDQYKTDAPEVEKYQIIADHLDSKEQQLVYDANRMISDNPDRFQSVDQTKLAEHKQALEAQLESADRNQTLSDNSRVMATSVDNGIKPSESTNPIVKEAVDKQIDATAETLTSGGKNPGLLSRYSGAPREVMAKWGGVGKKISDTLSEAVDKIGILDSKTSRQIQKWYRAAGGKDGMRTIAKALDGDMDSFSNLSEPQVQVFNQVRDWFTKYADDLGLPETSRISEYLPHMFGGKDIPSIDLALAQLKSGKTLDGKVLSPREISAIHKQVSGLDYEAQQMVSRNSLYTIKNGFLEKRKGANNYSFELADIISAYGHAAHETMYLKPAFSVVKDLSEELSIKQNEYLAKAIHAIGGKPTDELGSALNASLESIMGNESMAYSKASQTARKLIYDATIGLNPATAVRNLSQGSNTYSKLGAGYFGHGMIQAARSFSKNSGLYDELVDAGVMHNTFSDQLRNGTPGSPKSNFNNALWGMFTSVEQINRATAYFGAKQKALDAGMSMADAIKAGREMSRGTQFEFSAMDIPIGMQSTTMKNLTQFQSYNLAQVKFIAKMFVGAEDSLFVKGANGSYKMQPKALLQITRYVGANLIFISTLGAAMGMKPSDMIPYSNEVSGGDIPKSPIVKILFGDKSTKGITGLAGEAISAAKGDETAQGNLVGDLKKTAGSTAAMLIPGGSQAKKTIEGLDTTTTGMSRNASGKIRYAQGTDNESVLQSALFGQYSTKEGQNWIKKDFPTLSDSQTKAVDETAGQDAKKQLVTFYQSIKDASGRTKAYDAVKTAATNGDTNKATRLADEHNKKVDEALKDYYKTYGSDGMTQEMQDYLDRYAYIDVQKIEDNIK